MITNWISWASKKSGNDGRRASGVQWQRTKLAHLPGDNYRTLCGRQIGPLERSESGLPRCLVCERRQEVKER